MRGLLEFLELPDGQWSSVNLHQTKAMKSFILPNNEEVFGSTYKNRHSRSMVEIRDILFYSRGSLSLEYICWLTTKPGAFGSISEKQIR